LRGGGLSPKSEITLLRYNRAVRFAVRLLIASLALLVFALNSPNANACERMWNPMSTPTVGVAVADLVIVGQVTALQNRTATVKITRALQGRGAPGEAIQVNGVTGVTPLTRMECGQEGLAVGKSYVLLLWSPAGTLNNYYLIDDVAG